MKKIVIITLLLSNIAQACTFIITNDSRYQNIYLVGDEKLPKEMTEQQLEESNAIKIPKGATGELHKVIYIYTPKAKRKGLYERHFFCTTRYCGQTEEENTLRFGYTQIAKRKFSKDPKIQQKLTERVAVKDSLHGEVEPEYLLTREHN